MSHPYQASVKSNNELQQGLFPSWHDRRLSHTSEQILESGRRKSGSFEALQEFVKRQQDKDEKKKRELLEKAQEPDMSNKIKSIVKDTTSGPAIIVHDTSSDDASSSNFIKQEDTTSGPAIIVHDTSSDDASSSNFIKQEDKTSLKKRPSVRFK